MRLPFFIHVILFHVISTSHVVAGVGRAWALFAFGVATAKSLAWALPATGFFDQLHIQLYNQQFWISCISKILPILVFKHSVKPVQDFTLWPSGFGLWTLLAWHQQVPFHFISRTQIDTIHGKLRTNSFISGWLSLAPATISWRTPSSHRQGDSKGRIA